MTSGKCFLEDQCPNLLLPPNPGLLAHLFQSLRDEGRDLVGFLMAVGECLVEGKVRKGETTEWRLVVVACVDANRAVEDVNAVTSDSASQRQQRRGCMSEHAGLAAIVLIKIHVARPN